MPAHTNPTKAFWQSRTVWLNVAATALTIFMEYDNPAVIAQALPWRTSCFDFSPRLPSHRRCDSTRYVLHCAPVTT